ncbi:uncharacterized protein LOC132797892 [Drosophila nasuta]|uniref:uncharacterized protein LOC132797892 n=1 Tax=Drosophila nasuta TaxID=42062 RepID=UPI00295F2818|nr:uncharacterized protein LOC132797892 [Drosophila nasuta]
MDDGVGAAVYCPDPVSKQSYKLPDHCSIFQAEVFAIGKAAELARGLQRDHTSINIFVDSQAAIRSMHSDVVKSKVVLDSRRAIESLNASAVVRIYWIPSHQGIDGNEIADTLAKEGVGLDVGNMCNVPISLRTLGSEIEVRSRLQWDASWRNANSCKTARLMCASTNKNLTKFVMQLSRKDCRLMLGILTGHCMSAVHAVKMGITNSDQCRKCNEPGLRKHLSIFSVDAQRYPDSG